jgi:hypothetical protein
MTLAHGPAVPINGMVLSVDAANPRCYPGTGTTVTDLSGRGNTGTTVGSPAYSTLNQGKFTFNGTDQRIGFGNASSMQITLGTVVVWFNASNTNTGFRALLVKQFAYGLFVKDNVLATYDWGNNLERNTGITVGNGTWNHAAMAFSQSTGNPFNNATIYLNGIPVLVTTIRNSTQIIEVQIGDGGPGTNQLFVGDLAYSAIYNRVLQAAEIRQSFNALRGRFGV